MQTLQDCLAESLQAHHNRWNLDADTWLSLEEHHWYESHNSCQRCAPVPVMQNVLACQMHWRDCFQLANWSCGCWNNWICPTRAPVLDAKCLKTISKHTPWRLINSCLLELNGLQSSVIGSGLAFATQEKKSWRICQHWRMFCRPHECRLPHWRTSTNQVWSQQKESPRLAKGESCSRHTFFAFIHTFTELIMSQTPFPRRRVDVDQETHAISWRLSQIACHFISTFVHSFHSHFVFFEENHLTIFWEWSSSSLIFT